jgi:hypothetical protein
MLAPACILLSSIAPSFICLLVICGIFPPYAFTYVSLIISPVSGDCVKITVLLPDVVKSIPGICSSPLIVAATESVAKLFEAVNVVLLPFTAPVGISLTTNEPVPGPNELEESFTYVSRIISPVSGDCVKIIVVLPDVEKSIPGICSSPLIVAATEAGAKLFEAVNVALLPFTVPAGISLTTSALPGPNEL